MGEALLEQVINGLMMGSIYVLVALGMVLIYGVMHVVNFAHGVLFTLGGYLGHFFYYRVAESYLLAIVLAVMSLAIIGVLLERGVFRPLSGNLRNQVIASLGLILFWKTWWWLFGVQVPCNGRSHRQTDWCRLVICVSVSITWASSSSRWCW